MGIKLLISTFPPHNSSGIFPLSICINLECASLLRLNFG